MGEWQYECLNEYNEFNQGKGWESALERRVASTIFEHANKFNLTYIYQATFGEQSGGMSLDDFEDEYNFRPDNFNDSSWNFEIYRVDFLLEELELAIEVDGRKYHKDKAKDNQRDLNLYEHWNLQTLHIPQEYPNSYFFSDWLYDKIIDRINELSID